MVARNHANPAIQRNLANQRNLILLIKSPKGLDVSNIHPQITYSIKICNYIIISFKTRRPLLYAACKDP